MEQEGILFILVRMVRDPFLLSHGSKTTIFFFLARLQNQK